MPHVDLKGSEDDQDGQGMLPGGSGLGRKPVMRPGREEGGIHRPATLERRVEQESLNWRKSTCHPYSEVNMGGRGWDSSFLLLLNQYLLLNHHP